MKAFIKSRITKKKLSLSVSNINYFTNNKVVLVFSQGCGTCLIINGISEYGLSNKVVDEKLEPMWLEAKKNASKYNID